MIQTEVQFDVLLGTPPRALQQHVSGSSTKSTTNSVSAQHVRSLHLKGPETVLIKLPGRHSLLKPLQAHHQAKGIDQAQPIQLHLTEYRHVWLNHKRTILFAYSLFERVYVSRLYFRLTYPTRTDGPVITHLQDLCSLPELDPNTLGKVHLLNFG